MATVAGQAFILCAELRDLVCWQVATWQWATVDDPAKETGG